MKKILLLCAIYFLSSAYLIAAPVYWDPASGGNGHYYEYVNVGSFINRNVANTAAQAKSYLGVQGHLATITSAAENTFVSNNWDKTFSMWLGGYYQSGWKWVTGESWVYQNWDSGQPDNTGSATGDFLLFYSPATRGVWHDAYPEFTSMTGYLVEYDVLPTPEPNCLIILGIAGILMLRKLRKS